MFAGSDELTPKQKAFRRKWVVLFSALESLVETGIKLTAALLTGSTGLLADCIHSGIDVVGSLMVWVGVRLAPHKYKQFPYGFYRIEIIKLICIHKNRACAIVGNSIDWGNKGKGWCNYLVAWPHTSQSQGYLQSRSSINTGHRIFCSGVFGNFLLKKVNIFTS